jgi:hypothetical protein
MPVAVRVIRGCVDVPGVASVAEQRRINWLGLGLGARNFLTRRYCEGEVITTFSEGEAKRLAAAGIVELLPVS